MQLEGRDREESICSFIESWIIRAVTSFGYDVVSIDRVWRKFVNIEGG